MTNNEIVGELKALRDLVRHRDLTWAHVSGTALRYMLGCVAMNEVLQETERLGTESPLSTATKFADAEHSKASAILDAARHPPGAAREAAGRG